MFSHRRALAVVATLLVVLVAVALATTTQGASAPTSAATRQPLDLVYISDSSGWSVASFYARHIRQDLGVAVRVHDQWEGGLPAAVILERLRDPGHSWIDLIRNAEVIVVYGNPIGLGIKVVEREVCHDGSTRPPAVVGPRTWRPYVTTLKAIYKQIFAIRKGKPVILRTANWYVPGIYHGEVKLGPVPPGKSWQESGIIDVCTKFYESHNAAIARAAAAYRIPMADVYRAFNGPNHLEDPVAKGYIQADNIHPNDKGRAVIAKTLADLGYTPVKPPR